MDRDLVDVFISQWRRERPDLDPSSLGVVSRVLLLSKQIEQSADRALARFGISLWQFDVLAALRRAGPPFALSPTDLTRFVTLTSGAMTNRIDRLEQLGFVRRERDAHDRRGVLVALTPEGKRIADESIAARLEAARQNLAALDDAERAAAAGLLRKLVLANAPPADEINGRGRRRTADVTTSTAATGFDAAEDQAGTS